MLQESRKVTRIGFEKFDTQHPPNASKLVNSIFGVILYFFDPSTNYPSHSVFPDLFQAVLQHKNFSDYCFDCFPVFAQFFFIERMLRFFL